ncbi:MFS transporter [Asanoa siamensis]|uniref:MFS transporter n=1 Tax=Asanoa siamensis TaxID=926357 RepID=A0ABQ4CWR6_9ACTN|nr:MFS transporter [Asanoa siamensis]GIF75724.1 MFS transporter [Asanoa siamensis]
MPPLLSLLVRNPDFRRLFVAELVVFGSDWFVMVPLLVLLPELTGSGTWGAFVLAADTGITALVLPYAGTIADRLDRRRVMITANVACLGVLLLLLLVRGPGTAWLAIAVVGGMAVAKGFYSPAASAALPNVVRPEDLGLATTLAGSAWGTMAVLGASLGGILSATLSPYACFWIAAVAVAGAAVLATRIRGPLQAPRDADEPAAQAFAAIGEALRYIARRPTVLALVTVKSAVGLGNGVLTVFPLLAAVYGAGPVGAGLLFALRGLGAVVGPFALRPVLTRRALLLPGLALSMSAYGLAYLGVSVLTWFPLVLVLVFLAHFAAGSNWTMSNYALQTEVPDRLRGRVFATDLMVATLAVSLSQLAVATVVDTLDERVILAGCGAVTLVYAVGWWLATRRLSLTSAPAVS